MKKEYPIIYLNGFIYALDNKVELRNGSTYSLQLKNNHVELHDGFFRIANVIATNEISLNLPLLLPLPVVEDKEFILEKTIVKIVKSVLVKGQEYQLAALFRNYERDMENSKTTNPIIFTENDMRSAFIHGTIAATNKLEYNQEFDKIIERINPKPIAVELEIEDPTSFGNGPSCFGEWEAMKNEEREIAIKDELSLISGKLKIDKNNFVKVVKWIFQ